MKENKLPVFIQVTFWDDGLKYIYVPASCLSEEAQIGSKLFIVDAWCDECMEWLEYLESEISDFVKPYDGDEDFSWNPYYCDESKRNILEVIVIRGNQREVLYSFLNYTIGGNVLRAEDFLFKHKIAKSKFDSYFLLRHTERNTTLFDIINMFDESDGAE